MKIQHIDYRSQKHDRSIWKKSLSQLVSFTEPQIFINHCLLTKIYVERGKHSNGQRRERERQVGVTVCDVLATAVTHCNGVGVYFTGSISHGTNIHLSTHRFWNTHTHSHTINGPTVHVWPTGLNLRLQHPWLQTILDALIHSYTPLQMVILWSWSIVAAIPVMASISFLCRPFGGIDSVLEWSAMIPTDDVEHYSSLFEMEEGKVGLVCIVSSVKFTVWSQVEFLFFFLFLPPTFIRCTLTSVVLYVTVKDDQKYVWKVVSVDYERPAVGQGFYVSYPVPDGQNLVSLC